MGGFSMTWQRVSLEDVYQIHKHVIARAGTKAGVRDFALLHSAIERPNATFDGKSLYPTVWSKAAALMQSLCMNHPFTDGNKRTAWTATHRLLWINGIHLHAETKDAADFMVAVDNEQLELKIIADWLQNHATKRIK